MAEIEAITNEKIKNLMSNRKEVNNKKINF